MHSHNMLYTYYIAQPHDDWMLSRVFTENEEKILTGEFEGTLIMHICSPLKEAYDNCSAIAFKEYIVPAMCWT